MNKFIIVLVSYVSICSVFRLITDGEVDYLQMLVGYLIIDSLYKHLEGLEI